MAFEVGTRVVDRGQTSPASQKRAAPDSSKATGLDEAEIDARTVQDACELIRATYRATAELITVVYLR